MTALARNFIIVTPIDRMLYSVYVIRNKTRAEAMRREKFFKTGKGRELLKSLLRGSAAVAQETVNLLVVGSNPTPGADILTSK